MVRFQVIGKPAPAGSKRAFVNRGTGRAQVVDASARTKPWQALVQATALDAVNGEMPLEGPVEARFTFYERRPKSHFNSKGELNALGQRTPYPAKKPDVLKLARAVEDALTGVVYRDDSQIVKEELMKVYGEWDGVFISVQAVA